MLKLLRIRREQFQALEAAMEMRLVTELAAELRRERPELSAGFSSKAWRDTVKGIVEEARQLGLSGREPLAIYTEYRLLEGPRPWKAELEALLGPRAGLEQVRLQRLTEALAAHLKEM